MLGFPLTFIAPFALLALAALPALWFLLRITPPQPRRVAFPPLKIFIDLLPQRHASARTPWWLLLLRLVLAALVIVAMAGPIWNPTLADGRSGPLLLIMDNGFAAAGDWRERAALAVEWVEKAARESRIVAVLGTAEPSEALSSSNPASALDKVRAFVPRPILPNRAAHLPSIKTFLDASPDAEAVWISDGVAGADGEIFAKELAPLVAQHPLTILQNERASTLALAAGEHGEGAVSVRILRAEPNGRDNGTLRALDQKGLPVAEAAFTFAPNETQTTTRFEVPIDLRNAISRIDIAGESSAGAVNLLDERSKRRRVGIVFGGTIDQASPLLSPTYYISRALAPYAEIREGRGGGADVIRQLLNEQISVLILADVGSLDEDTHLRVSDFVEKGGLLLRFAGSRLAASNDDLVPVRLRRGGRSLGGTLSWDSPRTFAPFLRESPFFGLPVPDEIGITRQILAEPESNLAEKTWASLADGTPIVTAVKRGEGRIVLFHVTADTTWSNLPLSGLFVDMLRRVVALSGTSQAAVDEEAREEVQTVSPRLVLDGYGIFSTPPATARAVGVNYHERSNGDHPPGFYGAAGSSLAVNALANEDRLTALDLNGLNARIKNLAGDRTIDLRMFFLLAAIAFLIVDSLASLWLGGHLGQFFRRKMAQSGAAAVILLALVALPQKGEAQEATARESIESALVTRLAYVVTGDAQVDATSKAGLVGLTQALGNRTALVPGTPVGVDPARDELSFYPLLYWPIVASRPLPQEAAIRRLDTFMKGGGTVIFDTRDAGSVRTGGSQSAEAQYLRRMLSGLDIPELEPLPRDHVLTKTFYLLEGFEGRYATGETWVEVLPPEIEGEERRPARSGDGVSPIIITSNDLAAAWAVGRRGEALYPTLGNDPRQREMAMRGGINLTMYALTGNYKADQVHVPALLERLGQ